MDSLVSTDRCDRCGAQAYVRFNKGSLELDFCGHHTTSYGDLLDLDGWNIAIDTRNLLAAKTGAEVR